MALFKTRSGATPSEPEPSGLSDESVEALRVRARRRLIGSAILVLLAVVGFPLVFDHQPRSVAPMNVRVDIPNKDQTPSTSPVKPTAAASAPAPVVQAPASAPADEAPPAPAPSASSPSPSPAPAEPKAAPAEPPAKPAAKTEKVDKADKTEKSDKSAKPAGSGERYVIQMGAFSEQDKAKELLTKLERAGLKAYIQTVKTSDGPRTRVRLGPYTSEDEARKVLDRVKALNLNLQAQLLKL